MKHILRYNEYLLKESVQTIQWTNSIETFIDDYKDRIKDKLVSLIMKYILNDIYPSNKDDISTEDRKKYNGLNSFDKVSFLCINYKALINRNISEKIASISDYLSDRTTDINVIRGLKTFDELYDLSVIYHKNLGVEYKDERMDEGPDTDVFITYPNGWYWINLNTDFSEDEKENMGHCGQDSGKILFSLRDDKKQSHITASYEPNQKALYQIKGKYNSKPLDEYHDKIIDMILNNKYEVNYMKIGGYRPDLDFNLQDLDKKRRNTIFKKKPILKLTDKMFVSYFKKKDYKGIVSMINNGYTGYPESNIDLYGNPSEFETFKTDCENLRIDYKKIVGYCFDISKVLNNGYFELAYIVIENRVIDSEFGKIVLGIACTKGYLDIVKMLIFDKKMNVSGTTYYVNLASEHGHIDIVKLLVENGADITSDATNECLRRASGKGYIEIVKYLIDNGVDVSIKYDRSLLDAVLSGHFEIAKLLVDNGADINKNGNIALEYAVRSGNIDIVKYLLDNGSGVSGYSDGPIQKASMEGYYEIAKLLVDNGAVKHSVVASECLKVAAKNGHYDIVKLMLDNGADVSITDNYAIRNASKNGYIDVVELLKKYGAEL
jgi:hypothetical protein